VTDFGTDGEHRTVLAPGHAAASDGADARGRRLNSTDVFCLLLLAAVASKFLFGDALSRPAVQAWTTVFIAICVQAAPFVALGVAVSTAIAVFVPPAFFERALPRRSGLAVPVAGLAGGILPGCECGSVPVAASLSLRGVRAGPAVAFLLSAPAINPVVLIATAVAFPGHPVMVLARFLASLATALTMGWLWTLTGRDLPVRGNRRHDHAGAGPWQRATATASHDLAQTFGLLVIGAASAATVNVVFPQSWLAHVAGNEVSGVLALAVLAVVLAVCSESDAFIAASLSQFSLTARLVFMVVGPAVDLKLIALQTGTFGGRFSSRFAPLTWIVAVAAAVGTGMALL
jgi:uncharacterized membrane protein YraQ (UPF0718 family)